LVAAPKENETMTEVMTLEVCKADWKETRVVSEPLPTELAENEVLLQVDQLALTANNISYASAGDALGYWGFFPAEEGWGRIPAMGWADVIASAHAEIAPGERVWGFFPFTTHLKILAGKHHSDQFSDVSPHRADYAPVYAQFSRASTNPIYSESRENQDSLLRGLFMTSWLVEDFMAVNEAFGGEACLITSASSKTSIALGHCVKQRGALKSVGITSRGNVAFCESLGCYDLVTTYDDISSLDSSVPVVMVDMAGSSGLLSNLHHHYMDNMKYSCRVGATHQEGFGEVDKLPGATPEFFFAPAHIQTRSKEMGATELMMMLGAAYVGFRQFCDAWLRVEENVGPDAVESIYQDVLAGSNNPAVGQMISMWPKTD
jgi:NADPH:quinone reductase-like Zn-dependent oxidoreductase